MPAAMQEEHKPFFHTLLPSAVISIREWWSWLVGSKALAVILSCCISHPWYERVNNTGGSENFCREWQNIRKVITEWCSFHRVFYLITLTVSSILNARWQQNMRH